MADSLVALRDRREQVIARLTDAYAADLYDVDELDRRLDLAHGARTVAELDALVADLGIAPAATTALVPAGERAIDDPSRPARKKLRVIMSSVERRSRWIVPSQLDVRVFWGNATLDFRDASLGPGVTTLAVSVWMSNLELILPPGLPVDVDVSSFMGNVEERHRVPADPDPARPMLRVVGGVWLGNLEISTRLPGESGRDARKRERKERKQRRALAEGASKALPPGNG
ncbi:MAG TPA: DUF1707 domain-containing protein [Kofleriaceae bacterium]|nr:DUF1707 domain-containing protein [Kofleriaceae bacterium]